VSAAVDRVQARPVDLEQDAPAIVEILRDSYPQWS
jgi:hypothetical protein